MSDNVRKFKNKSLDDFFSEIKDISYVLDGTSRIELKNEYHYTDLLLFYRQNKGQEMTKYSLFDKHTDLDGKNFIRLTARGSEFIKNYNMFYNHKTHNVKISKKNVSKYLENTYVENRNDELINDIDKSITRHKRDNDALKNMLEEKISKSTSDSMQLIIIKDYSPFYGCDDFKQFNIYKN
jgi:hypothetical protein